MTALRDEVERTRRRHLVDQRAIRRHAEQALMFEVSEAIGRLMVRTGTSKTQLSRLLGRPESAVKQILDGTNITIRTLARVAFAMGYNVELKLVRRNVL
jgi:hypothetical protein